MAEAIVSTLKAKIKANDEELQMFQDKWEIIKRSDDRYHKAFYHFGIAFVISIFHIVFSKNLTDDADDTALHWVNQFVIHEIHYQIFHRICHQLQEIHHRICH